MDFISEPEVLSSDYICINLDLKESKLLRYGLWIPLMGVTNYNNRDKDLIQFLEKHYPHISDKLVEHI